VTLQLDTLPPDDGQAAALLSLYHPPAGVHDEVVDRDGRVRPHWRAMLQALGRIGQVGLAQAFALADRHQRDAGVYYRVYGSGDSRERAWPLSHVPLVLPETEWRAIEAGLVQRAALLERLLADLYGTGSLCREGVLPAALVAGSPDFIRPAVGLEPRGGRMLHVYAADLGRGPDGRWWVLGDRAQAPSGMGFALENRIALSRALPEIYGRMNVRRLAPFFQVWRDALAELSGPEGGRVGLLTPGPLNETAFEHAYLARYLGFLLVEGGDLAVRDGAVHVRTVGGLKRMNVLVRRLDSEFADPLELDPASRLGVPGLVQAVRGGAVTLANALGSGVLESPGLMGFLPALHGRLGGGPLAIPGVATSWCGEDAARWDVLDRLDMLALRPAWSRILDWPWGAEPVRPRDLGASERALVEARLMRRGGDLVAQEEMRLSTMPVWRSGRLEPRPFTLRVFVVATQDGWAVMPGGLCRVSENLDDRSVSMQRGGRSADVWILGEGRVDQTSLLPAGGAYTVRRAAGALPSRAAENLFWLGRHLERAEAILRAVRVLAGLAVENSEAVGPARDALVRLAELLVAWGAATAAVPLAQGAAVRVAEAACGAEEGGGSAYSLVAAARRNAAELRDRLSPDTVRALTDLAAALHPGGSRLPGPGSVLQRTEDALRIMAAFSGHVQETMNRLSGWRFLEVGRRVERGITTARLVRRLAAPDASPACLEALLEAADSQATYRLRYMFGAAHEPVLDLVVLDEGNPRAVAYQVARLKEHLQALSVLQRETDDPAAETAALLAVAFDRAEPGAVGADFLLSAENRLMDVSNQITSRFFTPTAFQPEGAEEAP
jgi:uncharacterized circularly permuted ATP-grasp superfamily protein/uncharacterized alpha-E superfamily protein